MPDTEPRAGMDLPLKLALRALAVLGVAAIVYVTLTSVFKPAPGVVAGSGPAGVSGALVMPGDAAAKAAAGVHEIPPLVGQGQGEPAPDAPFLDGAGKTVTLADFKGQVVVLNLWATWCAPCRKEMPTLAALQTAMAGKPVKVVAVSVDSASAGDKPKAFIAQNAPLTFYQDLSLKLPFAIKPPATAFPTTILYDKAGRERARVLSDVEWTSERVKRILTKLAAE